MPSDLVYYLTFYIVIPVAYICILGPLATLAHELGHALVNLAQTKQPVYIYLGIVPHGDQEASPLQRFRTLIFSLGKVTFHIKPCSGPAGFSHWTRAEQAELWTLLAGPLASLLMGIIFSVVTFLLRSHSFSTGYFVFEVAAAGAFLQFLTTIIPIRYPAWWGAYAGLPSDGYQIKQLLRQKQTMTMP